MSENTQVLYSAENGIAAITMNRPESLNSLNDGLAEGMIAAIDKAEADDSVRVVILTGAGRAFCAGGDLGFLKSLNSFPDASGFIARAGEVTRRIYTSPKPFIAFVNGTAAGAGVNFMLACDIIIASEKAKFTEAFSKVGLVPDCGGMYLLSKAVGLNKAKELMLTADIIDAREALRIGLVNHICPDEEIKAYVTELAEKLAARPTTTLAHIKSITNDINLTLDGVLKKEPDIQASLMLGPEGCEGMSAFLEKRPPKFK